MPAKPNGLVSPVIFRASQHERVFDPNDRGRPMVAMVTKRRIQSWPFRGSEDAIEIACDKWLNGAHESVKKGAEVIGREIIVVKTGSLPVTRVAILADTDIPRGIGKEHASYFTVH